MSEPAAYPSIDFDDYLRCEESSLIKHKLIEGKLYAMTGGSVAHGLISANIIRELGIAFKGAPCRVYSSDFKVKVGGNSYYPDVTVARYGYRLRPDRALLSRQSQPLADGDPEIARRVAPRAAPV